MKATKKDETQHRYFLRRTETKDYIVKTVAGTQEEAVKEARQHASQFNEQIDILMLVGRVSPPVFTEDTYEPM